MKKRNAAFAAMLCLLLALLFAGCLYVPEAEAPQQDPDVYLAILPAEEETAPPLIPEQPSENMPDEETLPPEPDDVQQTEQENEQPTEPDDEPQSGLSEESAYSTKDEVALYIHTFGHLPPNYVKKAEAREAGWGGGSLEKYFPGCSIGGDRFGNNEKLLPAKKGRTYYECDIDTVGKSSRGAKRIVFSDDGLIYYTDDHYASFTLLYGEAE